MTTYGDLIQGAAQHLREGAVHLHTEPIWSPAQAWTALVEYHGVLDAIASHARRLLLFVPLTPANLSGYRKPLTPFERAAKDLVLGIEAVVGTGRPHPSQLVPSTTPWAHAALHLRAASDLLATHFRIDGEPRTPDTAPAAKFTARRAALSDLGTLAITVLAAEEALALRAHQAGLDRAAIVKVLPGLGHLAMLADRTRSDDPKTPLLRLPLETLGLTTVHIRRDDALTEFADRMKRLRLTTFALRNDSTDALATLRDVTVIGVAVHAHTAAFHGADLMTAGPPAPTDSGTDALIARARAWQLLGRQLADFAALSPPDPSVREDLQATTRLLPTLAPLNSAMTGAQNPDPSVRIIGAALNGALTILADVGGHCSTTFARLARSDLLHVDARAIPRDVVAESPDFAEANLHGLSVAAPPSVVDRVLKAYEAVWTHPITVVAPPSSKHDLAAAPEYDESAILRRVAAT